MNKVRFAERELERARSYVPERVPGKGRFGKSKPGIDYLPEKDEYCEALIEYIELAKSGEEPSPRWQLLRLGYVVGGAPDTVPEYYPDTTSVEDSAHPVYGSRFGAFHTY